MKIAVVVLLLTAVLVAGLPSADKTSKTPVRLSSTASKTAAKTETKTDNKEDASSSVQGSKCEENLKKHPKQSHCLCVCLGDSGCSYMCDEETKSSKEVLDELLESVTTTTTAKPKAASRRPVKTNTSKTTTS